MRTLISDVVVVSTWALSQLQLNVCINYWGDGHLSIIGPDEDCSFATTTISLVPLLLIVGVGVFAILALFVGYNIRKIRSSRTKDT